MKLYDMEQWYRIGLGILVIVVGIVMPVMGQKEVEEKKAPEEVEQVKGVLSRPSLYVLPEQTVDPDKHRLWMRGELAYPAQPDDVWEGGVHFGHYFIDGDVDRWTNFYSGFGFGLHLRKALYYLFSVRYGLFYGQAYGVEPFPRRSALLNEQDVFAGYGPENPWFAMYRTRFLSGSVEGIVNLGNLLFHQQTTRWNYNVAIGVGAASYNTYLNLRDEHGNIYQDLLNKVGWTYEKFNSNRGRREIKNTIKRIYDKTFETPGPKKAGIFRINDQINFNAMFTFSAGVAYKVNRRFNIGFEHKIIWIDSDYLDGIKWRTNLDQSNNVDIGHYTHLIFAFNLGNLKEKAEPLYWLNPLDFMYQDIASVKRRPVLELTDTDGDGVVDMFDKEPNTPAQAPVDVQGRALDSDQDGIIDLYDEEPYSPPGYEVDEKGRALLPEEDRPVTKRDMEQIVQNVQMNAGCCPPSWFFPMIHFDRNSYCIKPEFYPQLKQVASVMQQHPDLCVAVVGYTDARSADNYNLVLSYNRAKAVVDFLTTNFAIPRHRFKLMYEGESKPLIPKADQLTGQRRERVEYLNRRVEFRVCRPDDINMTRPEGPPAGSCDEYDPDESSYIPTSVPKKYRGVKSGRF